MIALYVDNNLVAKWQASDDIPAIASRYCVIKDDDFDFVLSGGIKLWYCAGYCKLIELKTPNA